MISLYGKIPGTQLTEVSAMRGIPERQMTMLSLVSPEQRVSLEHPIRRIKALADQELARLSPVFDRMYATTGRPSIPPERVLKSLLLIALYSIRGERQFCDLCPGLGGRKTIL